MITDIDIYKNNIINSLTLIIFINPEHLDTSIF